MLLEQLVQYAARLERDGKTLPFMYAEATVRWLICLDEVGTFLRFEMTSNGLEGKKEKGKLFATPNLARQAAKAKLLCDDAPYVLGLAREKDDISKVQHKHQLFWQELRDCYAVTQRPDLKAVIGFLANLPGQMPALPSSFQPSDSLTFVVGGRMPIEDSAVQAYWASKFIDSGDNDAEGGNNNEKPPSRQAECLISGQYGPVMRIEPVKIKGGAIPGGQTTGMNITSSDKDPFASYGLKNIASAPIGLALAVQYANALNTLLQDPYTHLRVGPAVYVFWTKEREIPPIADILKRPADVLAQLRAGKRLSESLQVLPDSEQVKKQLQSVFTGSVSDNILSGLPTDSFYAACFSATGGRVVVRSHLTSTVEQVGQHLTRYFANQALFDSPVFGVFELAACLYRDANKELTASTVQALLENALRGTPLPHRYLVLLASRNRAEQKVTKPRAVLARMTLISIRRIEMNELTALQPQHPSVGYQLGRLMAALESLQYSALGKINASVVDRFYGAFSSTPVVAYSRLMAGVRNHVSKLSKENPGAAVREEQRLQQIHGQISSIPARLDLEEQALFSLGYYHEKAERFAQIEAAKSKKEQ
jgi:CRISPR-associated protein Csd1